MLWRLRKVSAVAEFYPMPDEPDLPQRVIPLLRAFTVFNRAQLDDVPAALQAIEPIRWEPDARARELLLMSGATIRHGGSRACYRPGDDEIHLPRAHPARDQPRHASRDRSSSRPHARRTRPVPG